MDSFLRRIKESTLFKVVIAILFTQIHSSVEPQPFIIRLESSRETLRNLPPPCKQKVLGKKRTNERTNEDAPRNFFGAATRKCFHFYESDMREQIQLIPELVSIM